MCIPFPAAVFKPARTLCRLLSFGCACDTWPGTRANNLQNQALRIGTCNHNIRRTIARKCHRGGLYKLDTSRNIGTSKQCSECRKFSDFKEHIRVLVCLRLETTRTVQKWRMNKCFLFLAYCGSQITLIKYVPADVYRIWVHHSDSDEFCPELIYFCACPTMPAMSRFEKCTLLYLHPFMVQSGLLWAF